MLLKRGKCDRMCEANLPNSHVFISKDAQKRQNRIYRNYPPLSQIPIYSNLRIFSIAITINVLYRIGKFFYLVFGTELRQSDIGAQMSRNNLRIL